jgi:hypothetical protein
MNILEIQGKIHELQAKDRRAYKLARKLFPNKWEAMAFLDKKAAFDFCLEHQEDIKSWLKGGKHGDNSNKVSRQESGKER